MIAPAATANSRARRSAIARGFLIGVLFPVRRNLQRDLLYPRNGGSPNLSSSCRVRGAGAGKRSEAGEALLAASAVVARLPPRLDCREEAPDRRPWRDPECLRVPAAQRKGRRGQARRPFQQ